MSIFKKLFKHRHDYSKDSALVTSAELQTALEATFPLVIIELRDVAYMRMREQEVKDFVAHYHVGKPAPWQKEFPDCDDFTIMAWGDILHGAIDCEFRYVPIFGYISLLRPGQAYHAMNWALTDTGIWLYEPQNGRWSRPTGAEERVYLEI